LELKGKKMPDKEWDQVLKICDETGWCTTATSVESIDSTSSELRRTWHLRSNPSERRLLVADQQTAGRGRGGHQWHSPQGVLAFSFDVPASDVPKTANRILGLAMGVAVKDALTLLGRRDVQIKWPNDVMIQNKKVAGILVESAGAAITKDAGWVVGIGVNVSTDFGDADGALRQTAISLLDAGGSLLRPADVLGSFARTWTGLRRNWMTHGDEDLLDRYRSSCWLTRKKVEATEFGELIRGVCRSVDSEGQLIIDCERQGILRAITQGGVSIVH
jgi:BirA family biotin operon repressor/biotin-[acetyl-CoA-carboxylase] ligase